MVQICQEEMHKRSNEEVGEIDVGGLMRGRCRMKKVFRRVDQLSNYQGHDPGQEHWR